MHTSVRTIERDREGEERDAYKETVSGSMDNTQILGTMIMGI